MLRVTFPNTGPCQRLITPPAARRLGSVVSGDAHVCACVIRGEARDHVQCDAPRFCGIPSKWNIERQLIVAEEDAALTSIGLRECDESLHLARGPNFEFHARSIGPYLRDGRSRSWDIREHSPRRARSVVTRLEGLRFRDQCGLPAVDGHGDSLRSTSDAELRVDVVEVFAHRPGRDEEHSCDFTIRRPR